MCGETPVFMRSLHLTPPVCTLHHRSYVRYSAGGADDGE